MNLRWTLARAFDMVVPMPPSHGPPLPQGLDIVWPLSITNLMPTLVIKSISKPYATIVDKITHMIAGP